MGLVCQRPVARQWTSSPRVFVEQERCMKAQVKGTAVLGTIRFIKETFGDEGLARVKAHLSSEDQQRMDDTILSSAWYPVSFLLALMRAANKEFGAQMPDIITQIGRASADYAHTTVYKLVFKVGSPQWIISKASVIFSSFYDVGQMVVTESGPGFANVEMRDFGEPAPEFCERIAGWIVRTFELSGAKDLRLPQVKCACKGDKVCRFEGTWK